MKFYTPEQIAEYLQVDILQVMQWLEEKKLSAVKIGEIWRVEKQQLQSFFSEHSIGSAPVKIDKESAVDEMDSADYEELLSDNQRKNLGEIIERKSGRGRRPTGIYLALEDYLRKKTEKQLRLTFSKIEDLLGRKLPASARTQKPWWGNSMGHTQAKAWMQAGWLVHEVDLTSEWVVFKRR